MTIQNGVHRRPQFVSGTRAEFFIATNAWTMGSPSNGDPRDVEEEEDKPDSVTK